MSNLKNSLMKQFKDTFLTSSRKDPIENINTPISSIENSSTLESDDESAISGEYKASSQLERQSIVTDSDTAFDAIQLSGTKFVESQAILVSPILETNFEYPLNTQPKNIPIIIPRSSDNDRVNDMDSVVKSTQSTTNPSHKKRKQTNLKREKEDKRERMVKKRKNSLLSVVNQKKTMENDPRMIYNHLRDRIDMFKNALKKLQVVCLKLSNQLLTGQVLTLKTRVNHLELQSAQVSRSKKKLE